MSFLFNSVLYVPNNYHMAKEEKGEKVLFEKDQLQQSK